MPVAPTPWYRDAAVPEINAWIAIAPDDTVTIRIGQTEIGTGVMTCNAMIVADELQCDWRKVRSEYASANRDVREKAPEWTLKVPGKGETDPGGAAPVELANANGVYRRMIIHSSGNIRESRYYLQLAGAEARERLLLAAANMWKVPVSELVAKDSVITHAKSKRRTTYGAIAARAAEMQLPGPVADQDQDAGQVHADRNRAEEPRCSAQGDRRSDLRHRHSSARHALRRGQGVPGVGRRCQGLQRRCGQEHARGALGGAPAVQRPDQERRLPVRRRRGHCRHMVARAEGARRDADRLGLRARRQRQLGVAVRRSPRRGQTTRQGHYRPRQHRYGVRACGKGRRGDLLGAVFAARAHGTGQGDGARRRRARRHLERRPGSAGSAPECREADGHRPRAGLRPFDVPGRRLRQQRQRAAGRAGGVHRQHRQGTAGQDAVDPRGRLGHAARSTGR